MRGIKIAFADIGRCRLQGPHHGLHLGRFTQSDFVFRAGPGLIAHHGVGVVRVGRREPQKAIIRCHAHGRERLAIRGLAERFRRLDALERRQVVGAGLVRPLERLFQRHLKIFPDLRFVVIRPQ